MKIPTTSIKNIVPYIKFTDNNTYSVKLLLLLNNKWSGCFKMMKNPYDIKIYKLSISYNNNTFIISDVIIDQNSISNDYTYDKNKLSITYFKSNYMRNKIIRIVNKIHITNKKDISILKIITK